MPYISREKRAVLNPAVQGLADAFKALDDDANFAGNLNFALSKLFLLLYPQANYQRFNDIVGALECCKLELYRKRIAPYEEIKEKENGPV